MTTPRVIVVGGGPAGLMATETLLAGGARVDVYDAMPSLGRKFLLAGVGGMNITHSEALEPFLDRYGAGRAALEPAIRAFDPPQLRAWIHGLGVETFVGSSGRVFPREMKAAPLLRAWLHRLKQHGAALHVRHRWLGWSADGALRFATPDGDMAAQADAVVLALGGASWKKLGSDGAWVPWLTARGVAVSPLQPSNCGFDVGWSDFFAQKFAGAPLKAVYLTFTDAQGQSHRRQGEFVVTQGGVEGSLIYAFSARLRDEITRSGQARIEIDLLPGRDLARIEAELRAPRGADSMANHLRRKLGLEGVKAGLLRECTPKATFDDPATLAAAIKALPIVLRAPRPIDEAISSAGGIAFAGLDHNLMLRAAPGVFCAGEMLDWEAPTGGYLLTACFATGRAAGQGALAWLASRARVD
ncbi:TIGR03862 family flavoprotein [Chitiniphilus eburneus]|uniref:TIGR03862 family flavoprotein n=1 Tax=Chitiniphilus eburneus TaxID=2571148 RepID=A0A4U0QAW9_9NEIS|nr:TIGR03862 family flavoprotein [Chitiniphilus eburneus]TJZ77602.1 TIGR03862 family flavoprotein [Chitiniphilus eburneus]